MDFNMQIIFMILTLLQMFVPIQCNFTRKLEWNGSREKSGAIYRFTAGKGGEGFENKYPPRDYDKMSQTPPCRLGKRARALLRATGARSNRVK